MNTEMLEVSTAQDRLLAAVAPSTMTEVLPCTQALGRVLSHDAIAPQHIPAFANSAMDGYAVRSSDLAGAADVVRELAVIGTSFAGRPMDQSGRSTDDAQQAVGTCARIFTGAAMPSGFDAVVMQEDVEAQEDGKRITTREQPAAGAWVRPIGHDVAQGATLMTAGTIIRAQHVGLLASAGITEVEVTRRPRIAVFSNGDELVAPGTRLAPGQIYDSNRLVLIALLQSLPVEVLDFGAIPDQPGAVDTALRAAVDQHADAIITSGGVSVGDADFVRDAASGAGTIDFWRVAIKPGKPFMFGQIQNAYLFGLPGNPVSTFVTYQLLVKPALWHLCGHQVTPEPTFQARLTHDIERQPGRAEWQRARLAQSETGELLVTTTGNQSSAMLSSVCQADCFVILPRLQGAVAAGTHVAVAPFWGALE